MILIHTGLFSTINEKIQDTTLEIEIVNVSCAIIRNIGDTDAINVEWKMWLDCNILLISPEKQNGHIDLIKANEEKMIML